MTERFMLDVNEAVDTCDVQWLAKQLIEAYELVNRVADLDFEEEVIPTPDGFVTVGAKVQKIEDYRDIQEQIADFLAWGANDE